VGAFYRETSALIDRVVFDEPRSYLDLFTLNETYGDDELAAHYGYPAPGGPAWVSYAGTTRSGILGHGSVLAAFSKFSDTSPTQRGIFIRTRLMCQVIPPPPATVNVDQPPGSGSAVCKEDRYSEHRTNASCAACHGQMDPIGFGLENYNMAGQWRDHDDGLPECPIAGVGSLPGYGGFSGPAELASLLVDSGEIERCAVEHVYRFAVGRRLTDAEAANTELLGASFAKEGYSMRELLLAVIGSGSFGYRREPAGN